MIEELMHVLFSQLKKIPKSLYLPLGIGIVGISLFGYGLIQYLNSAHSRENNTEPQVFTNKNGASNNSNFVQSKSSQNTVLETRKISIDIEGGVLKPGVYVLEQDQRVQDALIAAGGLSTNADRIWIEKQLNLAAKLTDGAKVYIPRVGENSMAQSSASIGVLGAQTGLVSLNSASESDLEGLSGVGPVTAQKIISARPFSSLDELVSRKVVSKSVFEKIKDKVSL